MVLITSASVSRWLLMGLECQYPEFQWKAHQDLKKSDPHVVILGSSYTYDTTLIPTHQVSSTAIGRLAEGYRIYRQVPKAEFITSGPKVDTLPSMGRVMANAAVSLGVAPNDTGFLYKGYNTRTEAKWYSKQFPKSDTLILATDAYHMPRAMYWFKHYGKTPIPAPTNFMVKHDPYDSQLWPAFSIHNIEYLRKAIHEYVGYAYALWLTRNAS